jgi:CRP/FNR family transcriptional regulator, cyclic AMP receptor protein
MPAHNKLWHFERFPMISALSDAQRRQLAKMTRMLEVKRGTRVYLPGDPSDEIFLLKSGVIKISAKTPDNREVILAFLHAGDIFGELAVVDDAPRDHGAEAYDDCVICAMSRDAIRRVIRETPEIGFQITKLIGLRLRTFRSRIEELLCKSAHARLAHALLDLAERHGVPDRDGVLISLRLSQGDLGRLVGLSRETVNAILQDWREQELLEMDRRSVRLRNPDRLRKISTQPATSEKRPDPGPRSH